MSPGLCVPAQQYVGIDWDPDMKKRFYNENEAEVCACVRVCVIVRVRVYDNVTHGRHHK